MINLAQIYEGWRNKLIPPAHMKNFIEVTSKTRTDICWGCEHHSENAKKKGYKSVRPDHHCVECGCTLAAKTRCLSCKCPLDKWLELLTDEEEAHLKNEMNGKEKGGKA